MWGAPVLRTAVPFRLCLRSPAAPPRRRTFLDNRTAAPHRAYSMPVLSPYTLTALRAAVAAAEIHRASFGRATRVDYKGRHDVVTDADRASEAAIIAMIREAYPDHGLLGEEGGRHGGGPYR